MATDEKIDEAEIQARSEHHTLDLLAKLPRSKGSKEPADAWEKQTLSDKWSERKAPRPNSPPDHAL